MAGKEATVYILDLGRSMGEKRHGRDQTDLDWALEYVWDKITTTVATGRKSALMSVIGCRTDDTDLANVMEEIEGYENLKVFSGLKQYLLDDIRNLQQQLSPSSTNDGDLFSALVVALQMMESATQGKTGPLKYDRRVIIITDGRGGIDTDDLDQIASKINDERAKVEIVLLGIDFDDEEYGYKEENKDPHKAKNEEVLKKLVDVCNGSFGTLVEAVDQLHIPRLKETRPVPSYRGQLTLGDPKHFEATLTIDVERYPCTMIAKPPTASRFVVRTDLGGIAGPSTQSSATITGEDHPMGDLSAVRNQRVYQVDDEEEPGTKKNVEMDELERGYEYGRTAVHISESDLGVVKLETEQSLQLVGFVPAEKFDRYLPMSRTNYIVPQRANQQSQLALSSFVHALFEADIYAVARMVTKENKPPIIVLLVPQTELGRECLVDVELPFEEDMRRYKFPPLDRKITVSGKIITEHRDLPNADLTEAMSAYVDAMDLSSLGEDDEGNPGEYAKPEDTYAPLVHRINHIVKWRATHPDPTLPIPNPPEILTKYSTPPAELMSQLEVQLSALIKAADVKKVPPKVKGRGKRRRDDREKPLSGLDVDELLGNPKRVKVESNNLIPSFKQALAATDDLEAIQEAADSMAKEVRSLISNSVGESAYGRALEAIRVMRDEITELEEPEIYNTFIRELKKDVLGGKLNGERRDMWWRIRGSRYGLVDQKRSFVSDVTEDEALEFYKV
ncbi:SPOC domain-like protein [Dothidotthia symphoricarpi CBS 119687]|uniref:ATP-dependent DNA helicase II subunit 2 n=1 Tax=Dothidotthia symphoricarpi CBS 119687 TaxID=1392245 RepID=A0A6A6A4L7_9PLEO|nr:SPOC domain-like protein [Dothidotthia symphoricarpi CBS 119687]KAF2125847.1 SPOC domain-like protein [Dothidotthia symphoricarpi CBS 119687]